MNKLRDIPRDVIIYEIFPYIVFENIRLNHKNLYGYFSYDEYRKVFPLFCIRIPHYKIISYDFIKYPRYVYDSGIVTKSLLSERITKMKKAKLKRFILSSKKIIYSQGHRFRD